MDISIQIIKRGGARPGAGRKPSGRIRKNVSLEPEAITVLTELGGGELSAGINMAALRVAKLRPIGNGLWQEIEQQPNAGA